MGAEREIEMKRRNLPKAAYVPGMVLGVTWYREADWPRVKALFPDANELHDTYAEWLSSADDSVKELKRNGMDAKAVLIDIDAFVVWCLAHGHKLDAKARAEYTTEKLQEEFMSGSLGLPGRP